MFNFRSINDLNKAIISGLHKLPRDVGLIVGIPRSGLLAANIIALHLNLPMTDLDGLLEGRIIDCGNRIKQSGYNKRKLFSKKILVVDDSILLGNTMLKTKQRISAAALNNDLIYCAIYTSPNTRTIVDIYFEVIRGDRIFEWNVMHSKVMTQSCVDIDGVLCVDPTEEENDDGERYRHFLLNTKPLRIPSVKINSLVTCRLEKYRSLTEKWLQTYGVEFEKLIMMDLPNKEARKASGRHASFKAEAYQSTKVRLFIESNYRQAAEIAKITNKPVLCTDAMQMVYPSTAQYATRKIFKDPISVFRRMRILRNWFNSHLFDINPPNIE